MMDHWPSTTPYFAFLLLFVCLPPVMIAQSPSTAQRSLERAERLVHRFDELVHVQRLGEVVARAGFAQALHAAGGALWVAIDADVYRIAEAQFAAKTTQQWLTLFEELEIPAGALNTSPRGITPRS
mgnify:CR=1 FL=1